MQVSVEQGALLRGLEHTLGVVDKRGIMPILAHCLVEANGQGLVISATDLEISFRGAFPAEVRESGTFTVRAHTLHSLVKGLPKDVNLEVTGDDDQIKLIAGESRYKFLAFPAEQFPPLPAVAEENLVEVEAAALVDLINKVLFSMGDDLQYHLQAVLWERVEHEGEIRLRLVSTDGHRLSLAAGLPGLEGLEALTSVLVPAKAMREIKRFAEHNAKDGKIHLGLMWPKEEQGSIFDEESQEKEEAEEKAKEPPQFLCLKAGGQELSVRLLGLKFPEYQRIIPESFEKGFTFNRQELAAAIRRISLLTPERFRGVVFTLAEGTAELTHENPDVGKGRELVEVLERSGTLDEPLTVGFNARYLLEPLAVMKGDLAVLEINEPARPALLRDPGAPGASWLVMPMDL
jgi:DNA polymerase III subunit beta